MFKRVILSCLVCAAAVLLSAARVAVLPEIDDPAFDIVVDRDRLIVPDRSLIRIYSLFDFRMIGCFGRRGEGPEEFKGEVSLTVLSDVLFLSSDGKISYFTRDGRFIREIVWPEKGRGKLVPIGEGYVGFGPPVTDQSDRIRFNTLRLYDAAGKPGPVFTRSVSRFQRDGSITFMNGTFNFKVHGDLVWVQYTGREFRLDGFDRRGRLAVRIENKRLNHRAVTSKDRTRALNHIKMYMPWVYEARERIRFPRWWGGVGTFFIDKVSGMIYVITYVKQGRRTLFCIYDASGGFQKDLFMVVGDRTIWAPYPLDIHDGKLYQLIENLDEEVWELHVTPIG